MQIVIDVAAYYDWEQMTGDEAATLMADPVAYKAEVAALLVKTTVNGDLNRKVLVEEVSQTTIAVPESQIADLIEANERLGTAKSRAQVTAFIVEKTMPHHAHPDHFTKITVEGEPAIERMLNAYFNTAGE